MLPVIYQLIAMVTITFSKWKSVATIEGGYKTSVENLSSGIFMVLMFQMHPISNSLNLLAKAPLISEIRSTKDRLIA